MVISNLFCFFYFFFLFLFWGYISTFSSFIHYSFLLFFIYFLFYFLEKAIVDLENRKTSDFLLRISAFFCSFLLLFFIDFNILFSDSLDNLAYSNHYNFLNHQLVAVYYLLSQLFILFLYLLRNWSLYIYDLLIDYFQQNYNLIYFFFFYFYLFFFYFFFRLFFLYCFC